MAFGFETLQPILGWEALWAPYDQPTYQTVLAQLRPQDIVLEIGAGDLRLARQMALTARHVFAVEINAGILPRGLEAPLPANLTPIQADARLLEFPASVNTGVLLMRHCTHFRWYIEKLHAVGATRLITNARWGMGVEAIALQVERIPFSKAPMGWYACWCGSAGFKEGPAGQWLPEMDGIIHEVADCPQCRIA